MYKKISKLLMPILLLVLAFPGISSAGEGMSYDFNSVDVQYVAQFQAFPRATSEDSWIVQLTGSTTAPVDVLYGVVVLKTDGLPDWSEEFIKVSGPNGSERFLANSGSYDYFEGTEKYKQANTFFWSAKKLVDNTVVKDFTKPIRSISLYRSFDESQNLTKVMISFSDDGETANEMFWSSFPLENQYWAEMPSINDAGNDTAKAMLK